MLQTLRRWTSRVKRRLSKILWAMARILLAVLTAIIGVGAFIAAVFYVPIAFVWNIGVTMFYFFPISRWLRLQILLAKRRLR